MNTWGREAFACHPHSLFGPMAVAACGENGPGTSYPTGGANTADVWPPLAYTTLANLSRPFFLFTDDPLYAVRGATVLLWVFGMGFLAKLMLQNGARKTQVFALAVTLTSLPSIGYFSSFISPYAAIPILTSYALWSYQWFLASMKREAFSLSRVHILKSIIAAIFPVVLVLSVPHTVSVIVSIAISLLIFLAIQFKPTTKCLNCRRLFSMAALSMFLLASAYLTKRFYDAIRVWRQIDYPPDVLPDAGVGTEFTHDPNWFGQALARAWSFFPNAINSPLPVPSTFGFFASFFTMIAVAFVVTTALGLTASSDKGALAIGVLLASPVSALFYYYTLSFEPPPRYGLALAFLGFSLLGLKRISGRASLTLSVLSLILFYLALTGDKIYIEQPCWSVGGDGYLELCEAS